MPHGHSDARSFTARITAITPATPNIHLLRLRIDDERFAFRAGQWIELSIPGDGDSPRSMFSICSAPNDQGVIELALRHTDSSPVTDYLAHEARTGDAVTISTARGDMGFDPAESRGDIVLIGGGTGIAPLMSILRHVNRLRDGRHVTLFYSAATQDELLFTDELHRIQANNPNFHCYITLTRDSEDHWEGLTGRIDAGMLNYAALSKKSSYFLCGPPAMVDTVVDLLRSRSVPPERLRYDKWW